MSESLLRLPAELTIYTAGETREAWLPWLATQVGPAANDAGLLCEVDASAVDQVDAAGLQLLVSLSLALGGRQLRLVRPSGPLRSACEALGLDDLLGQARAGAGR